MDNAGLEGSGGPRELSNIGLGKVSESLHDKVDETAKLRRHLAITQIEQVDRPDGRRIIQQYLDQPVCLDICIDLDGGQNGGAHVSEYDSAQRVLVVDLQAAVDRDAYAPIRAGQRPLRLRRVHF